MPLMVLVGEVHRCYIVVLIDMAFETTIRTANMYQYLADFNCTALAALSDFRRVFVMSVKADDIPWTLGRRLDSCFRFVRFFSPLRTSRSNLRPSQPQRARLAISETPHVRQRTSSMAPDDQGQYHTELDQASPRPLQISKGEAKFLVVATFKQERAAAKANLGRRVMA